MDALRQDFWLAVRSLIKNPATGAVAVLTLALGVGANGTILALADAVLLQPLNVPDAHRIVHIYQRRPNGSVEAYPLSFADYLEYRAGVTAFSSLAAHYPSSPMHVVVGDDSVSVTGAVATANYFEVLGLQPATGRFFTADEDRARGRDAVATISYGFWQRHFGGSANALGSSLRINGRAFTIVGVAPRGFAGVYPRSIAIEIWIPSAMFDVGYRYCDAFARDCTIIDMLGKLRDGVSLDTAQRELDVVATRLQRAYPATNEGVSVRAVLARGVIRGGVGTEVQQLSLFVGAVGVVLLIACANIAGLLFARTAARRKEIAMRLALGATRRRVLRQLLTESVVLATAGAVVGLIVAAWGTALVQSLYAQDPAGRPVDFQLPIRFAVAGAIVVLSLLSAFAFGLVPSIHASRTDVTTVLKQESGTGSSRARFRHLLVTMQVALAVMLLVGAGLLVQSMRRLYQGPGFAPDQLVMMRLRPSLIGYSRDRAHAFQRAAVERLESVPGVVAASPSVYANVFGAGIRVRVSPPGAAEFDAVGGHGGARHFETLGIMVLQGRDFSWRDDTRAPRIVIVNEVLARRVWPQGGGSGETLVIDGTVYTVIGVVADAQYYAAGESPRAQVFFSYWQPPSGDLFLNDSRMLVRVAGNAAAMMTVLRRAVATVDENVPISEDHPLSERVRYVYQPVRLAQSLLVSLAVLALILTAVGLYGLLAFVVTQRTREIGIRMALGARRADVMTLVLQQSVSTTLVGVAIGLGGAWTASQLTASLLYGVTAHDTTAFVAAPIILGVVTLAATMIPARRASRVSASNVVRCE
jgi:predicted permease